MKRKFSIIIFICLVLSGCKEKIYEDNTNDNIDLIMNNIEVYSDTYLYDIIDLKNKNIEIVSDNKLINTEKIGQKDIEVIYKLENKKYSRILNIIIVDNEAPIVFSGTNKSVNVDYDGDLCNLITYGDNYDGNLTCKIEGNYDLSKIGTYNLSYTISDSSNNNKEVKVTLNVKEKSNNTNNNTTAQSKKTQFIDILTKYKNDNNEIGIDVSKWQGKIDFEKVKNAGATFVMMRIGVQKGSKEELEIDPYFEENFKNARASGLKVGVYLYSIATSKEEAINHAKWVIEKLNGEKLDLPIVFDWENWSKWNSYKISFHDINMIADSFINTIKDNNYEGMLYSSKFYLETIWENKLEFPIWLAHYTDKTTYSGNYKIWQLCNNGRIDGINGDVDINIMYN